MAETLEIKSRYESLDKYFMSIEIRKRIILQEEEGLSKKGTSLEQSYLTLKSDIEKDRQHLEGKIEEVANLKENIAFDDKLVTEKELTHLTSKITATETSQQKVEEGIKTLTGKISALKYITAKHSKVLKDIFFFFHNIKDGPKSPDQFVQSDQFVLHFSKGSRLCMVCRLL